MDKQKENYTNLLSITEGGIDKFQRRLIQRKSVKNLFIKTCRDVLKTKKVHSNRKYYGNIFNSFSVEQPQKKLNETRTTLIIPKTSQSPVRPKNNSNSSEVRNSIQSIFDQLSQEEENKREQEYNFKEIKPRKMNSRFVLKRK